MNDFWGVIIFVMLLIVIVLKIWDIVQDWGKPKPVTMSEILYVIDQLGLSDKKAIEKVKHLVYLSRKELEIFIIEENRREDKRKFDERFNKNRGRDEKE